MQSKEMYEKAIIEHAYYILYENKHIKLNYGLGTS